MRHVHKFELKDGNMYLDGMPINGIKTLKMSVDPKENDGLAELLLRMDVQLLRKESSTKADNFLEEVRNVGNGNPE